MTAGSRRCSVATVAFDPAAYKETTRAQWQDAASAWHSWDPVFDRWLGPATELMLDLAGVDSGTRVIDIAAGSGGQSIAAGRRGATVLATDISSHILEEAAQAARALREGGKYAALVFAEPDRNGFFSVPIGIIRRRAELPPPAPGLPGPFSSATLGEQLDAAGFREVD